MKDSWKAGGLQRYNLALLEKQVLAEQREWTAVQQVWGWWGMVYMTSFRSRARIWSLETSDSEPTWYGSVVAMKENPVTQPYWYFSKEKALASVGCHLVEWSCAVKRVSPCWLREKAMATRNLSKGLWNSSYLREMQTSVEL